MLAGRYQACCAARGNGFRREQGFYNRVVKHEVFKGFAIPAMLPSSFTSELDVGSRRAMESANRPTGPAWDSEPSAPDSQAPEDARETTHDAHGWRYVRRLRKERKSANSCT